MSIEMKRAYDPPASSDGYRVLVDRLWPRGVSSERGHIDLWLRDIAPSTDLRTWFGHDVSRWPEFQERYERELLGHGELLDLILDLEQRHRTVTLVYGARDEEHNQATVLRSVLAERPMHSHV